MEMLVNNKIIALDLPVREVYKKVWLPNHDEVMCYSSLVIVCGTSKPVE